MPLNSIRLARRSLVALAAGLALLASTELARLRNGV